ncbi:exported hypothetical protein [Candidatus Desulfarcum epimagneticum]|uniref:C4-dicarboxylate ABC transporter substrate-binding protein n=1 Tax=uncultured Desulfobacteraceae bacterium TaxID=218296 RepID=A0A484HGS1_9BACT|nr:exported hypothetical protein [uncultured Desulfobacteraceae bacterium]
MGKKIMLAFFILCLLSLSSPPSPRAGETTWKAQTWSEKGSLYYEAFVEFTDDIRKKTAGALVIRPFPVGAFMRGSEMLDGLKHNIIQAANNAPAYFVEKDPAFAPMGVLPGAWTEVSQLMTWFRDMGGKALLTRLYAPYDAVPIGVQSFGMESISSRFPIRRMEDFKGRRIRVPDEGMVKTLFEKMGARAVPLPEGDILTALENQFVDMVDWGTPAMNYSKGFYKIAKHFNFPGFHSLGLTDFSVRKQDWERLSPEIRAIVMDGVQVWGEKLLRRINEENYVKIGKMLGEGAFIHTWDSEEMDRAREKASEAWDEWAQKSPMSAKVIESQKICMEKLGLARFSEMKRSRRLSDIHAGLKEAFRLYDDMMLEISETPPESPLGFERADIGRLKAALQKPLEAIRKIEKGMFESIKNRLILMDRGREAEKTFQTQNPPARPSIGQEAP